MNKNFVIDQSVYLVYENIFYDLHNDYKLIELNINTKKREVILTWIKGNGEWVNKENANEIKLHFKSVSYFQISENFIKEAVERIEEIGYKEPLDFDLDWLNFEGVQSINQHMFLRFQNDEFIRIYSEVVEFC